MQDANQRQQLFRSTIRGFIQQRKDEKLKDSDDFDKAAKYDYHTWLADAARRVTQIQAVTHVLKATHPDARGSSLYLVPTELPSHAEIGSHTLGAEYADDVVGNAAALDVYKFLKLDVEQRRLLDWFLADDPDLVAALHPDSATAQDWSAAFKGLIRSADADYASHPMAKQVYWCIGDDPTQDEHFHLLQPLFSSSLAHAVHHDIQAARFGEANKEARQARRDNQPHDAPYVEYRGLAVRKLGGTKPQNISQLNSERGGVNYLLSSAPPSWAQVQPRQLLFIDSALQRFQSYEEVPSLLKQLGEFLTSNPPPTMETRTKRERIEQALGQSLAAFGLAMQQAFPAGWTRDTNCKLPLCEQLWLDPERTELAPRPDYQDEDIAFAQAYEWKDWPDEVAGRFANWANNYLSAKYPLPVGDVEYRHWAKQAIVEVTEWPATMRRRAPCSQGGAL
ncbi:CRISPR-associated protein Csy1 [Azomonas agilis]|uniref:CRISPR-associated protein Csy1 n=1 Tax=Azomonas agilis TaxID=116849 RepID=A0A562J2G9_9GAMM|nr:type I-F CRISPR-associated protein Csy1 [Azomonas agilis]TWH77302.1 CRISPR-associated protein Csy1 [Azomonas agilis]